MLASHRMLPLLFVAALLGGCAGDGDADAPAGEGDAAAEAGPPALDALIPDLPPADPCAGLKDGQSCEGGAICPKGQQRVIESGKCVCRVSCNPKGTKQCGGTKCGRVCARLVDDKGQDTGIGACVPDPGKGPGEACGPKVKLTCRQPLLCIGSGDLFFCRQACKSNANCPGFKMVCGARVQGRSEVYCRPGTSSRGPKEGGDCSKKDVFCQPGLICDPVSKRCLAECVTDGAKVDTCPKGKKCTRLVDAAAKATVGYGCR